MDLVIRFPDENNPQRLLDWARGTLTCVLRCPPNANKPDYCANCPLHRDNRKEDKFMFVGEACESSDVRSIVINHCLTSKCGTGKGTGTCQFSTPDGGCEFDYKCPADFEKP